MSKVKKGAGVTAPAAHRARQAKAEEAARPVTGKTVGTPRSAPAKQGKARQGKTKQQVARKAAKAASAPVKPKGGKPKGTKATTAKAKATSPKAGKPKRATVTRKPAKVATPAKGKPAAGRRAVGRTAKGGKRRVVAQPAAPRTVKIRELDPVQKCGPDTSVQFLYRVDEQLGGAPLTAHLVFFDRHGWYCEHGRNCPAVADVRKHGKMHHLFGD